MALPGYVAQASLYQTQHTYRGYSRVPKAGWAAIRPQQTDPFCLETCGDIFFACIFTGFFDPILLDFVCPIQYILCVSECGA
jgi:hypothetical protein